MRFPDHKFDYSQAAMELSALDFHKNVYGTQNNSHCMRGYVPRRSHFLSRSQEKAIEQEL